MSTPLELSTNDLDIVRVGTIFAESSKVDGLHTPVAEFLKYPGEHWPPAFVGVYDSCHYCQLLYAKRGLGVAFKVWIDRGFDVVA